jgi:phosphatidate cytidylyltransferase
MAGLTRALGRGVPSAFLGASAGALCAAFALAGDPASGHNTIFTAVLLALVIGAGVMTLAAGPPSASTLPSAAMGVMAPVYVGIPLGTIARIRIDDGPYVVGMLAVFLIVSDSAQYFAGRAFGRRKLAPAVSPAKTVEGALAGCLVAGVVGATLAVRWIPGLTSWTGLALGLTIAIVGMAGDLFESLLKRASGVKDSSTLIPGHGGMLDRIDSWLFAAPAYFLFLRYVG